MQIPFGFDEVTEFDLNFDIDGFDMDHAPESKAVDTGIVKIKRYPRPRMVTYEYASDMARGIPDLSDGEAVYAVVSGNFIFGDFIEAFMVEKNYRAEEIIIATLSLGQENVDSLRNLQEGGYVANMSLIVSDYWYAHERRREGGVPYIMEVLGRKDSFAFAAAGLHTKATIIKTECGKHFVLHGSANLRSSRNLEQFCLENNEGLYEFNHSWMQKVIDSFTVSNKSIRGGKIWREVMEPTKRKP